MQALSGLAELSVKALAAMRDEVLSFAQLSTERTSPVRFRNNYSAGVEMSSAPCSAEGCNAAAANACTYGMCSEDCADHGGLNVYCAERAHEPDAGQGLWL